jgi:hypothetical protein
MISMLKNMVLVILMITGTVLFAGCAKGKNLKDEINKQAALFCNAAFAGQGPGYAECSAGIKPLNDYIDQFKKGAKDLYAKDFGLKEPTDLGQSYHVFHSVVLRKSELEQKFKEVQELCKKLPTATSANLEEQVNSEENVNGCNLLMKKAISIMLVDCLHLVQVLTYEESIENAKDPMMGCLVDVRIETPTMIF